MESGNAVVTLSPPARNFDFRVQVPNNSSVFVAQPDFSVRPVNIVGTLTSIDSFTPTNGTLGTNLVNYTGTDYNAVGAYTFQLDCTGMSTGGVTQMDSAGAAFDRYVPGWWMVSASAPTVLPTTNSFEPMNRTLSITGTTGEAVFVILPSALNPTFEVMNFPQDALMAGTLSGTDVAGATHTFNIWNVGEKSPGTLQLALTV